ncbi:MAG: lipoprotein NlpI [Firmicutes bacterium]|nr:lipoprotein NlpI [Bacillota bacterium]
MVNLRLVCVALWVCVLAACASAPQGQGAAGGAQTSATGSSADMRANQFILVEPLLPNPQRQIEIAQISQLIHEHDLSREQRAVLHYRRGALYDALGLSTLARIDFNQVLEYRPGMADAYNYIGIHATQAGDFEMAFEAFDSVLELDGEHPYVLLNRGIAAYYAGQYELAQVDLADFHYQAQDDAYRVLWLFFADLQIDPERAYALLVERQEGLGDRWESNLVRLFTEEISPQQLMASTLEGVEDQLGLIERLAEAYFYLGKYQRMQGENDEAANYFKLALATNLYEFIEHRYAYLELDAIRYPG